MLQEFRRISLSGYVMNAAQDNFYFMSLSRHHPQRVQASRRMSKPAPSLQTAQPCGSGGRVEELMQEKEVEFQPQEADSEVGLNHVLIKSCWCPRTQTHHRFLLSQSENKAPVSAAAEAPGDTQSLRAARADADSLDWSRTDGDKGLASSPQLLPEGCAEAALPPKAPVSGSVAESTPSASHSESGEQQHSQTSRL